MFRPSPGPPVPPMVSVFHGNIGWMGEHITASGPASATYEAASKAVYQPVLLPAPCVARRVWWANGATVSGGATIEVGIYADNGYAPGSKLVSGSATQGSASQVQFVDVTDTALPAGLVWLAISSSASTNTTIFRNTCGLYAQLVRYVEESASPLPATATPATDNVYSSIYLFGFATTASP